MRRTVLGGWKVVVCSLAAVLLAFFTTRALAQEQPSEAPPAAQAALSTETPASAEATEDDLQVEDTVSPAEKEQGEEAAAAHDPAKYAAFIRFAVSKVREKVLPKLEDKMEVKHGEKMERLTWTLCGASLAGLLLLFMPILPRPEVPGQDGRALPLQRRGRRQRRQRAPALRGGRPAHQERAGDCRKRDQPAADDRRREPRHDRRRGRGPGRVRADDHRAVARADGRGRRRRPGGDPGQRLEPGEGREPVPLRGEGRQGRELPLRVRPAADDNHRHRRVPPRRPAHPQRADGHARARRGGGGHARRGVGGVQVRRARVRRGAGAALGP